MRRILALLVLLTTLCGQAQFCNNQGFENSSPGTYTSGSAVTAWSVTGQSSTACTNTVWTSGSSEFQLVATPVSAVPGIGILPHSPLGGTVVAALNTGTGNASATRLSRTVSVTSANFYLNVAAAMIVENFDHQNCCDNAGFEILVRSPQGAVDGCASFTLSPFGCGNAPFGSPPVSFSVSGGYAYSSWKTLSLNLSAYNGSVVTIEIVARDCAAGGHFARMYFDAECASSQLTCMCVTVPPGNIHYCAGSNVALLTAPPSMISYSWTGPAPIPAAQSTLSYLQIMNPWPGSTYTLQMTNPAGCSAASIYTLVYTQVAIKSTAVAVPCGTSATGSATVFATGSGAGYNVTWSNSSASVVATASNAGGLPPGAYTVSVSALGSVGCGTASAVVSLSPYTFNSTVLNPTLGICSGDTVGMAVLVSGSPNSYQYSWNPPGNFLIHNTQAVLFTSTVVPGTAASQVYSVTVTPTLAPHCAVTSTIAVSVGNPLTPTLMPGTPAYCINGQSVQLQASPSNGNFIGVYLDSSGVLTPSSHPSPGMFAYQYKEVQGVCERSVSGNYSIHPTPQVTVAGNAPVCSGQPVSLTADGADTYTWNSSLAGNTFSFIAGGIVQHTVTGEDSQTNCRHVLLVTHSAIPLPTVNVSGPDSLCEAAAATLVATGADQFLWMQNSTVGDSLNIVALAGINHFSVTGSDTSGNCSSAHVFTLIAFQEPTLSITGNTAVCAGDRVALSVSGASNAVWMNTLAGSTYTQLAQPGNNLIFVSGTNEGLCFGEDTVMVQAAACAGLRDHQSTGPVFFPNPVSDVLFCSGCGSQKFLITNLIGEEIAEVIFGPEGARFSDFPRGVYFLRGNNTIFRVVRK